MNNYTNLSERFPKRFSGQKRLLSVKCRRKKKTIYFNAETYAHSEISGRATANFITVIRSKTSIQAQIVLR